MTTLDELFDGPSDEDHEVDREAECKRCGKGGLHWEETDEGWRLYDARDRKHVCDQNRVRLIVADDFDPVE